MPISKLGQRRQVVIPKEICDQLGIQQGDYLEVTSTEGKVIITPKKLVDLKLTATRKGGVEPQKRHRAPATRARA